MASLITDSHCFLRGLDYTRIERKDVSNGYECNFQTLKNTFNHLSTYLPEFLFVQIRSDKVVTKMHIKPNGYYNFQMEHVAAVAGAPHPTAWFFIPGGPVEYVNADLTKCNADAWFDLFEQACLESRVSDIDVFVNPYSHCCLRKDGAAPFYRTTDAAVGNPANKYMPILTPMTAKADKCYSDILVYGPSLVDDAASAFYTDKPGVVAWVGCATNESTFGALQSDILQVYNLQANVNRTFCETTQTLLDPPKWTVKPNAPAVVPCQYLLHVSDTEDKHTLLTKMLHVQKLIFIPRHVKVPLKSAIDGQHYVSVAADLSDLKQVLTWCHEHETECAAIVGRAKNLAESFDGAYMMGKTLNVIKTQSCTTHITDFTHKMLAWEKSYFNTQKQRDLCAWESYPTGHVSQSNMHPLSESFAKGCAHLLTHPKFSLKQHTGNVKDHCGRIVNAVNMQTVGGTENVRECLLESVNGVKFINRTYSSMHHMLHDFTVGTLGTNVLRKECANFQYVYGNSGYRTMVEYLDGPTLTQWLHSSDFNWKTLTNVLLQLCMALNYAYNTCNFAHYELTTHNVVLVKHDDPQFYMFDNQLHMLPACGYRAVIQRYCSSRCAVYREGTDGLVMHQMFDLFNPYHRPCIDVLTLMTHTFQTLCNVGVDISRAVKDYVHSFFGTSCAFEGAYAFGSMWKHSPQDNITIAQYVAHILSLDNVNVTLVRKDVVLPYEPGYHKHLINVCKCPTDPWKYTLNHLENMSIPVTHKDLFLMDYVRICQFEKRIFPFVDCNVPARYRDRWTRIRLNIVHRLNPYHTNGFPNHRQRKDDFYYVLTELNTIKILNKHNWMACVQKMHSFCKAIDPRSNKYCAMNAFLQINPGKLLHDITQRNML